MIYIPECKNADSRTCNVDEVSVEELLLASKHHIVDVQLVIKHLITLLFIAGENHDADKLTGIDNFYADFRTKFAKTDWLDQHRRINRHHLMEPDGIPGDVNLLDVLEFIVDCITAGLARSGEVYPFELPPELLTRAFNNTVTLIKNTVSVVPPSDLRIMTADHNVSFNEQL